MMHAKEPGPKMGLATQLKNVAALVVPMPVHVQRDMVSAAQVNIRPFEKQFISTNFAINFANYMILGPH